MGVLLVEIDHARVRMGEPRWLVVVFCGFTTKPFLSYFLEDRRYRTQAG